MATERQDWNLNPGVSNSRGSPSVIFNALSKEKGRAVNQLAVPLVKGNRNSTVMMQPNSDLLFSQTTQSRAEQSGTGEAAQGSHGGMRLPVTSHLLSLECGLNSYGADVTPLYWPSILHSKQEEVMNVKRKKAHVSCICLVLSRK